MDFSLAKRAGALLVALALVGCDGGASAVKAPKASERAFERNGQSFGAASVEDYVEVAHKFVADPPKGSETIKRANGDILIYDPKGNVFAVVSREGAPRALFKPDDGAAYWDVQKEREARRSTASRDREQTRDG